MSRHSGTPPSSEAKAVSAFEFTQSEVEGNIDKVGLLALCVIDFGHQLAGIKPEGESAQIVEALRNSEGRDRFRRSF